MGLDKLWESKQRLEQINQTINVDDTTGTTSRLKAKGPKFEERHTRITLYLENDVFSDLQALRSQGISQSLILNTALKEYFASIIPAQE